MKINGYTAQIMPIPSLNGRLPPDSYYQKYIHKFSATDMAAVFIGDVTLDSLNLDNPFGRLDPTWQQRYKAALDAKDEPLQQKLLAEYEHNAIHLILIIGTLTVKQYIYNDETDGACGIITAGDLNCPNIIVGGQEIFVTRNLNVPGVYWGDYNHGELVVHGNLNVNTLVQTDYNVTVKGQHNTLMHFDEETFTEVDELIAVFDPACLMDVTEVDEPNLASYLAKASIFERLEQGKSLLITTAAETPVFPDYEFTVANLKRLCSLSIIKGNEFDFKIEDVNVSISKPHLNAEGEARGNTLYLSQDETKVFVSLSQEEKKPEGLLNKIMSKPTLVEDIFAIYRDKDDKWHNVHQEKDVASFNLIDNFWHRVLKQAAAFERQTEAEINALQDQLRQTITVAKISKYLKSPIVTKKYNDFYDDDKNGYWHGGIYFSFRQKHEQDDRIQLMKNRPHNELRLFPSVDDDDSHGYQFDITKDKQVEIRYIPHNARGSYTLQPFQLEQLKNALKFWQYFEEHFPTDNQKFVDGNWDDDA